ncbi:MAG TPA: Clp protease N-terminal domain-containing protein [Candidatus Angelobacter sp.]|jgi:ATP-dependent Clp protease ATP-binding subunit ClpC|nr:Clp protease N-terminal domain-containing protein [Candidatus Angelobacter sp.]
MFERYTEKARRTIFFGRFEASQLGSPHIETEHLLLGLLREEKGLARRFLKNAGAIESIRKQIEDAASAGKNPPISTSVDLPLSNECRRVLGYAAEEAERLSHRHIGCEHLLLGLLREEKSFAAEILRQQDISLSGVREELAGSSGASAFPAMGQTGEVKPSLELGLDLVASALNDQQPPLVGRERELEQVTRILGRFKKNNPVLVGEPGVGKRAIVEGLARRIATGDLPSALRYQSIVALDLAMVILNARDRDRYEELMHEVLHGGSGELFLIEGLERLAGSGVGGKSLEIVHILKPALLRGTIQCIGITTPSRYQRLLETEPWVERCFEPVVVQQPNEAEALQVLQTAKQRYETFHGVTYTEEALQYAVFLSNSYLLNRFLPDKALDLIDEAGTWMKLNQPPLPQEVQECQNRMKLVTNRLENAVSNHELEKARFYSDEVRKEQENLNLLREKHKIDIAPVVTREIIEEVISRWTGVPVSAIRKSRLPEPQA